MILIDVRQRFVEFYQNQGYKILPSASMIDPSIPMSFVMSAGLVQVENSLSKTTERNGNRFVLVQKCFRHFDLEKVGTDDIHLSLFEMPGAFIFGPDGKAETVQRMWALATSVLGLDENHIWASYFMGGKILENYLPEDSITHKAWLDMGIPESHIVGLGTDNNYWVQGKGIEDNNISRKCGPNTELFYDRGIQKACSQNCKPGCKCGRFVEFSNSLFINSEITQRDRRIRPLDNPFTETVIGTERVNMVRQKAASVFDTKEFRPILDEIHILINNNNLPEQLIVHCERVIADHMKGLFCLVANGAPPPGKNGRERIIKILIRRVITRLLVLDIDILQAIPSLTLSMSKGIYNLDSVEEVNKSLISYFSSEHQRFMKTLRRGERQLNQMLKENNGRTLVGDQIVCLEKKWGVPSLLIALALQERKLAFLKPDYLAEIGAIEVDQNNTIVGR